MLLLTKTDFVLARTCPTKLYYRKSGYPSWLDEDEYLRLLADGGYMVEAIARMLFPEGREIEETDPQRAFALTQQALQSENVTLFQAALLSEGRFARVDILRKQGRAIDLIEVKARAFDGAENEARLAAGKPGVFRSLRPLGAIATDWRPYLEDVTFQSALAQDLYPDARLAAHLLLPDRSKTTPLDGLPAQFRLDRGGGRVRVEFSGDPQAVRRGHFLTQLDVTPEVAELLPAVRAAAEHYALSLSPQVTKIPTPISLHCRECEFADAGDDRRDGFRECWGPLADVEPSLFELYKVGTLGGIKQPLANELIAQGRVSLFDIPVDRLVKKDGAPGEDNQRQLLQLEHTRAGTEWVSPDLRGLLAALPYPLHFIDFETSALAVPYHAAMHPYENVAFQWSCHTLRAPASAPEQREWINVQDSFPNFEFARTLKENVGDEGTVFMWATHERTILRDVRRQMDERGEVDPALAAWLGELTEPGNPRLVDMNRLALKHYFHPRMGGRTSIKVVLDSVWQADARLRERAPEYIRQVGDAVLSPYETLPPFVVNGKEVEIREGTAAIRAYQTMLYGAERDDPAVREQYRQLLLQYCRLDTLAMVLIWWHWTGL